MGTVLESNFSTTLTASLGNAATDLIVSIDSLPTNSTGYLVLDPEGSNFEIIYYESKTSTTVTCATSNGRGLSLTATTRTTVAANRKIHSAGTKCILAADHLFLNDLGSKSGDDTFTGDLTFSGDITFSGSERTPVYATAAARNTAIPSPSNGMSCYLTDTGKFVDYTGGSWTNRESGGTFSNASVTVAGKSEEATAAEAIAGTASGGTGARLFVNPSSLTSTTVSKTSSAGAGDSGKFIRLDASGEVDETFLPLTVSVAELDQLDGISANVTDTNLSTLTAGATSDASALHKHDNIYNTLTAGESIDGSSTPQAVCMSDSGKDTYALTYPDGDYGASAAFSVSAFGSTDAGYKLSQSFTYTNADVTSITVYRVYVNIRKEAAPTDNVRVVIYDDDGNKPGSALTNGESDWVSGASFTNVADDILPQIFSFSTPPLIVSGTKYHYVLERSGTIDAVNYYAIQKHSNAFNISNYKSSYTASTQLWAAGTTGNTSWWYMYIEFNLTGGKVFKADSNNLFRMKFLGFTTDNVVADDSVDVIVNGSVTMSVTEGAIYYIDTTAGSITTTMPTATNTCVIPIGYGGDGELLLDKSSTRRYYETTAYFSNNGNTNTDKIVVTYWAAGGTQPWWIKTGITPFVNDSTATNGTIYPRFEGGFYAGATKAAGDMHTLAIDVVGY